ncbi:MAG: uracil-DNA glycosylase [Rickettsiales bacterium]|nr:uracil-DNA glycosylase [Rickettsiales bacterium]
MKNSGIYDLYLSGVKFELGPVAASGDATPAQPSGHAPIPPIPPIETNAAANDLMKSSGDAQDLDALAELVKNSQNPLRQFGGQTVLFAAGRNIKLTVITDMPGAEDDGSGKILSGQGGDIFDKMLSAISLDRDNCLVCPLVFWRAPGGRTPTADELALTQPLINRAIRLAGARAILTLGEFAKTAVRAANYENCKLFSIPHPNYLILNPGAKKAAWETLQELEKYLNGAE